MVGIKNDSGRLEIRPQQILKQYSMKATYNKELDLLSNSDEHARHFERKGGLVDAELDDFLLVGNRLESSVPDRDRLCFTRQRCVFLNHKMTISRWRAQQAAIEEANMARKNETAAKKHAAELARQEVQKRRQEAAQKKEQKEKEQKEANRHHRQQKSKKVMSDYVMPK